MPLGLKAELPRMTAAAPTGDHSLHPQAEVKLQIIRSELSTLSNLLEHHWAKFIAIMEGPRKIRPSIAFKLYMRTAFCDFDFPSDSQKSTKDAPALLLCWATSSQKTNGFRRLLCLLRSVSDDAQC